KKGFPLIGRVIGADGRPVVGALVFWTQQKSQYCDDMKDFTTRTDRDGLYRFGSLPKGKIDVLAQAKGHAPAEATIDSGTHSEPLELILERPRVIIGRVVDDKGKPVEGVFVKPDLWRGHKNLGVY